MLSFLFILGYFYPSNVWTCVTVQLGELDWLNWGAAPPLEAVTADVLHRPMLPAGDRGDLHTREIKILITAINRTPLKRTPHAH